MSAHPPWIRAVAPHGERLESMLALTTRHRLHTVCQSARCPNLGECWARGTATFLLLGPGCTRGCRYCAVTRAAPSPPDPDEPARVAEAVATLGLEHAVITTVTRDDLADGGAAHLAAAVAAIRHCQPGCTVEVLAPDFAGSRAALQTVLATEPEVFAHNLETVARLYPALRPGADYARALALLEHAAGVRHGQAVKSGLMVGLGETGRELRQALADLRQAGVSILSVGQYLRPGPGQVPVARYWQPEEFTELREHALALGFAQVAAAPLVRSSYRVDPGPTTAATG